MDWVETTGKSIEEATDRALAHLGVHRDDAEVEVIEEPRLGCSVASEAKLEFERVFVRAAHDPSALADPAAVKNDRDPMHHGVRSHELRGANPNHDETAKERGPSSARWRGEGRATIYKSPLKEDTMAEGISLAEQDR